MSVSSSTPAELATITPRCRHFGECGGCRLQDLSYEDQLKKKTAVLTELLARIEWKTEIPMHPSPDVWYYRNKMEFSFQDVYPRPEQGDYLLLGQKVRNRWDRVLNLAECHLLSPEIPKLLDAVHAWALEEKLEPYNLHRQTGFLRYLVVREGKNTGEKLVNLVTNAGELPKASFLKSVKSAYPATTTLWGVHTGKAGIAVAEKTEVLEGPGVIYDEILGKRLRVSPYSFFQSNTRGAEFLYGLVRDRVAETTPQNVLDLYCGGGGISLTVADACVQMMGVELVESAVEDARFNAGLNKIPNVHFMAGKVEDLLVSFAAQKLDVDVAIADPPRSGLHPSAVKMLKEIAPARIVYVSCNPKAMVDDIRHLADLYDLVSVEGVDLFPHTDHMEALAVLQRVY